MNEGIGARTQRLLGRRNIVPAVQEVTKFLPALFEAYHEVRLALEQPRPANWQYTIDDVRGQLAALLPEGFLSATPWTWLEQYPRFLRAMSLRLNKLSGGLARDRQQQEIIEPRWKAFQERAEEHHRRGVDDPELATYRWMLEELRVSLFAQELGTSIAVSPQRLEKQWAKVRV